MSTVLPAWQVLAVLIGVDFSALAGCLIVEHGRGMGVVAGDAAGIGAVVGGIVRRAVRACLPLLPLLAEQYEIAVCFDLAVGGHHAVFDRARTHGTLRRTARATARSGLLARSVDALGMRF